VIGFLRNRLQGIVAFSFLIIVALTFAFLGLPTFTQTFSENNYASVGKYDISQSEYFRSRAQVEQNLRDQFGGGIDFNDQMLVEAIQDLTNNSLIEKYTIINFFDELGIEIPDSHAENELSKLDTFSVDGKFDQDLFKNYLINFNLTKDDLIRDYKSDQKLFLAVSFLDALSNSYNSSTEQYLDLLTERRTVQYVTLSEKNVDKDFEVNEQELENYYEQNKEAFAIPEKRSYYTLNLSKDILNIEISDEDLESAYDLYLLSLPTPEKRVSHLMLIGSNYETNDLLNAKVEQVRADLANISFEDAVNQYSEDLGTLDIGGDLGFTNGEVFPLEFESQIDVLALNQISEPIFYEGNVHFLYISEISSQDIASFEDKKSELLGELTQIEYEERIRSYTEIISGTSNEITEVEEFVSSLGVPVELSLKYHEEKSFSEANLSSDNALILFETAKGYWSEPLQVTSEEYIFAFIGEEILASYQNFSDVRDTIELLVLKEKRASYLEDIYANTSDISLDDEVLTSLFELKDLKIERLKNINRSTSLLSNELINIVFNEYETDIVRKELIRDGLLFYSVSDRIKGDISQVTPEDRESIEIEVKSTILQTIFNRLREEYNFDNELMVNTQFFSQNS
tara:strand:+ start:283 stop:2163 length:1881 start_codon:yes stop_codon:yes gene_type:complete